jgi:hypothetical protein
MRKITTGLCFLLFKLAALSAKLTRGLPHSNVSESELTYDDSIER